MVSACHRHQLELQSAQARSLRTPLHTPLNNGPQRESRFIRKQLDPLGRPIIIIINYRDPHCIINDYSDN